MGNTRAKPSPLYPKDKAWHINLEAAVGLCPSITADEELPCETMVTMEKTPKGSC